MGHDSSECPRYSGVALRLLFSAPVPYAMLLALRDRMDALAESFLGNGALVLPHRKVTLLFDDDPKGESVARLTSALEPVMAEYGRLMQEAPRIVDMQHRLMECGECGSLQKAHVCPFPVKIGLQPQRQPQTRSSQGVASSSPPVASAAAGAAAPVDMMCKSWRRTHECPRLKRGDRCYYKHPPEYVVPRNVCFNFRDHGKCSRGDA